MSASADPTPLSVRPGPWSTLLFVQGWAILAGAGIAVCAAGVWVPAISNASRTGLLGSIVCMLAALVAGAAIRNARRYTLSHDRADVRTGVFRVDAASVLLTDVRTVAVHRSLAQRILGLETIVISTAGGALVWRHASAGDRLGDSLRSRLDAARSPAQSSTMPATGAHPSSPNPPRRLPVIGLAGGIGAGKSTVARCFERLGCLVIDSDARAKAALDRPSVRDRLVEWWGPGVLAGDRIDRGKVAGIVFSDPVQRQKLESLVHPIVRQERADMIEEARRSGARAVIVDAPLLFEAGVDRECDVVVFVDAPREVRLARVQASRGWTEEELARRERSQWSIEQKRARSGFVVDNSRSSDQTHARVERILAEILALGSSRQDAGAETAGPDGIPAPP